MDHPQKDMIEGLRRAADFLEAHPELEVTDGVRPALSLAVGGWRPGSVEGFLDGLSVCDVVAEHDDRFPTLRFLRRSFGPFDLRACVEAGELAGVLGEGVPA